MGMTTKRYQASLLIKHHGGACHAASSNTEIYKRVEGLGYRWNVALRQWEGGPGVQADNEFLSCPFCGGEGRLRRRITFFVRCERCGASGPNNHAETQAILLWNRRIAGEAAPAARTALAGSNGIRS